MNTKELYDKYIEARSKYVNTKKLIQKGGDYERLVVEIVGSYLMQITGNMMNAIVASLNAKLGRNVKTAKGAPRSSAVDVDNADSIVYHGRDEASVHWVYYDDDGNKHDPYVYKMQIESGHQFCQTHALRLAYYPDSRAESTKVDAYMGLLGFWRDNLKDILDVTTNEWHDVSLATVRRTQEEGGENMEVTDTWIGELDKLFKAGKTAADVDMSADGDGDGKVEENDGMVALAAVIFDVMNCDKAREIAPYWA